MPNTFTLFPLSLADQCATLEQGKRLKELGIVQVSMACWIGDENSGPDYMPYELMYTEEAYTECGSGWYEHRIAAWTAHELFVMMPHNVSVTKGTKQWTCRISSYSTTCIRLVDCLAQMIIQLLEHKNTHKQYINERLQTAK